MVIMVPNKDELNGELHDLGLTQLPDYLPDNMVFLNCSYNLLTTLKNSPIKVNGIFDCSNNKLTSLKCGPIVGADFLCEYNELSSLDGIQPKIFGDLKCQYNLLPNLLGAPKYIKHNFDCDFNHLTSLVGVPRYIGCNFWCRLKDVSAAWESEIGEVIIKLNEGMAILPLVKFFIDFYNSDKKLNKLLMKNRGSSKQNIIDFQYDLIENGFEDNAKWKPI